jgi:FkbM family methyltransferase
LEAASRIGSVQIERGMTIKKITFRIRKLWAIMVTSLWRRALLRFGVAAGIEHFLVLRSLGEVRTVVDVGANRGQFALVARRCFSSARIISFEPLPKPAAIFRRLFENDPKAVVHQVAIGTHAGTAIIHISGRDDSSSLLPITDTQSSIFEGTAEVGTSEVRLGPLEAYVARSEVTEPALLKLDVQGFELAALAGCVSQLERFSWIYVECSFMELYKEQALADEVIGWLQGRGFRLRGIYNATYDVRGCAVQADMLFERANLNKSS